MPKFPLNYLCKYKSPLVVDKPKLWQQSTGVINRLYKYCIIGK
ncbi:hypothetical protein FDUTEX481_02280 [Tolypothrix sp. PCC 7601]|nr:hypothetical protein FDUTEX481_02280 [Tolypothrix sp. PCC 7601]